MIICEQENICSVKVREKVEYLIEEEGCTKYSEIKTLTGHTDRVRSLAVLPDGSLASCSDDKTIKIWDTIKGIEIKTLTGHTDRVRSLAVLPDGSLASASGSIDTKIKIWDTMKGSEIKTLTNHTNSVYSLAVLPDGSLASGSLQKIFLWD